jgi:O-antigen/teichoic acid export membrane protein
MVKAYYGVKVFSLQPLGYCSAMAGPDQSASETFGSSHEDTIRATSIIGGASLVNVALGLVKMKVAAVMLGPVGIGVLGLLQNLLNAAATAGGLNLGVAGARQIVASESLVDAAPDRSARRAVLVTVCALAVASGLIFWLFREPLAGLVFQDRGRGTDVGWLAVGVAATAAAGYQTAVLSARRRIGDIARLTMVSATAGALIGTGCLVIWKADGILPFILASPLATLAFGWIFLKRAPPAIGEAGGSPIRPHIVSLLGQGASLTIAVFVILCGQLAIRTLVERKLGATALGHFQAAWTITTVYLFFIFQAMASDYLPRLTAVMGDREEAQKLVDAQAEVGILLAAPILLVMIGMAPWALAILFTSEFVEATSLLRYQMLGDLLRLAFWPVAIVLMAGGASRHYTVAEVIGTAFLVVATVVLLPIAGLAAPGMAYVLANLGYGALIMFLAYRLYGIVLGGHVVRHFALLAICCLVAFTVSLKNPVSGAIVGAITAGIWAVFAFFRLRLAILFRPAKREA